MSRHREPNQRARTVRASLWFCAVLLWCAMIFSMSAQPAEVSSAESGRLTETAVHFFFRGFDRLSPEEQEALRFRTEVAIRKSAHMAEYAVLAVLLVLWLGEAFPQTAVRRRGWISWGLAAAYAATDELHQVFVPGRSGEPRDITIDAAGAALGLLVFALFAGILRRLRK